MSDSAVSHTCIACDRDVPYEEIEVEEGMWRTGEVFAYRRCVECGSLQLADVPHDMSDYYDDAYYSYASSPYLQKRIWRTWPVPTALRLNSVVFTTTGRGRGNQWVVESGTRLRHSILDLGCGGGNDLLHMYLLGFHRLAGADPYVPDAHEVAPGVPVWKKFHHEMEGQFDRIVLHHTFEHVPDPRATLRSCRRLLAHDGKVVVRMPIMGKFAWREYGTNWVAIEPPRHLVVYTTDGFERLARSEGFRVEKLFYDSTEYQFWGSETVVAARPHSPSTGPRRYFTDEQLAAWRKRAHALNAAQDGDQGGYVLVPA